MAMADDQANHEYFNFLKKFLNLLHSGKSAKLVLECQHGQAKIHLEHVLHHPLGTLHHPSRQSHQDQPGHGQQRQPGPSRVRRRIRRAQARAVVAAGEAAGSSLKVRAETEQVTTAADNISSPSFSEPAVKAATPLTLQPVPPFSFSTSSPATPCTPIQAEKVAQVEQAGNILEDPKCSETSTAEEAVLPLPPCLDLVSLAGTQQHAPAEQQVLHQPPHPEEVVHDAPGTKNDKVNSNSVTSTTSDPASSDVKADFEKLLDEVFNRYEERLSEALTIGITNGFKK